MRRSLLLVLFAAPAFAAEPVQVQVLSAVVKDQRIEGAEVIVQKNGAQSVGALTGRDGLVNVTPAFADTDEGVLLIIKKAGYSPLVSKCPCRGMTYALSPVMHGLDGLRVVLTWGSTPADLDLHAVYPGNHVFFSKKLGRDANLDVDDTDAFGPETITIEKKAFGEPYVFAVHDFTNRRFPDRAALAESRARVFVYIGESLIRRYEVPSSGQGTLWTVFSIDGQGDFHDVDTLTRAPEDPESSLQDTLGVQPAPVVAQAPVLSGDATEHQRGGRARVPRGPAGGLHRVLPARPRAGAFLRAGVVEPRPLVPQAEPGGRGAGPRGRRSPLASGPDAATVRASSYYNVARIYEAEGQFADARVQYELAAKERPLKVYADSIKRMKARGAR